MRTMLKLGLAGVFLAGAAIAPASAGDVAPMDVKFTDDGVQASLTGAAGDVAKGRAVFSNRKQGNCLACHVNAEQKEHSFHGEVGPPLDGVADRYSEAELRAIVINSKKVLTDETLMPGFYSLELGARINKKFADKTILSAQQVEDVVAYLTTLKE
ncbi:sulfur oxidation c-type cytochrome SoxX [Anderseniella sp. Alg231-50]|uniref:sulfur oxidation c-type cytochrome SoxX n=1 Tax=Anderseniella sp. Alg231-50 TaxID=1922226 RepID=UPI000D556B98